MYLIINKCVTAVKVPASLAIISVTAQLWTYVFWVTSVYFNIRNTLPKSGTFLLGQPVYGYISYLLKIRSAGQNCILFMDRTSVWRTWMGFIWIPMWGKGRAPVNAVMELRFP